MGRCVFNADDVARCIEHAQRAENWRPSYTNENPGPSIFFVKDQGIYLMSNGLPADNNTDSGRTFVVYDEECYPDNPDCWSLSRDKVGGDDFVETIPATNEFLVACLTYDKVVFHVAPTEFNISFENNTTRKTNGTQNEISGAVG